MTRPIREPVRELEEKASSLSNTKIEKERRKEEKRGKGGTKCAREEELFSLHGSNSEQQPDQSLNRRDSLLFPSPLFFSLSFSTYVYVRVSVSAYA